jgi:hypothetical protein
VKIFLRYIFWSDKLIDTQDLEPCIPGTRVAVAKPWLDVLTTSAPWSMTPLLIVQYSSSFPNNGNVKAPTVHVDQKAHASALPEPCLTLVALLWAQQRSRARRAARVSGSRGLLTAAHSAKSQAARRRVRGTAGASSCSQRMWYRRCSAVVTWADEATAEGSETGGQGRQDRDRKAVERCQGGLDERKKEGQSGGVVKRCGRTCVIVRS